MICPNCNTDNRPDVRFCRGCGQRLDSPSPSPSSQADEAVMTPSTPAVSPGDATSEPQAPAVLQCPHCGESVKPEARFCAHCGKSLASQASAPPSPPTSPAPQQTLPQTPSARVQPAATVSQPTAGANPPLPPATPVASPRGRVPASQKAPKQAISPWIIGVVVVAGIALIVLIVLLVKSFTQPEQVAPTATAPLATLPPEPTIEAKSVRTFVITSTQSTLPELSLRTELSVSSPLTVGQEYEGVFTVTLHNDMTSTVLPKRVDILGVWKPSLSFESMAVKTLDPEPAVPPGEAWTDSFIFTVEEAGSSMIQASIKLEILSTNRIALLTSDELSVVVSDTEQ